jgi:hypothetical protein
LFLGVTVAVAKGVASISEFVFWETQRFLLRRFGTAEVLAVNVSEFCILFLIHFTSRFFLSTTNYFFIIDAKAIRRHFQYICLLKLWAQELWTEYKPDAETNNLHRKA